MTTLFTRDFSLLWQGQLVSQIGNQAFLIAMVFWVKQVSESATLLGLLLMCSSLPGVVLGPVAGALVDRHSRKSIIVWGDLLRGAAMLGLAGLFFLPQLEPRVALIGLFSVALFMGAVDAAFKPAVAASIPDLVGRDRLSAANSLNQFSIQGSTFAGQAVGGMLFSWMGAPVLFAINAISYLLSGLSECFIRAPLRPRVDLSAQGGYLRDIRAGFRYVWAQSGMTTFFVIATGLNFLFMLIAVLFPFYVTDQLGRGVEWYGFLLASISAGSVAGLVVSGAVRINGPRAPLICGVLCATALLMGSFGLNRSPSLSLAIGFGVGLCTVIVNIFLLTLLQITTPVGMRGRVIAILQTLGSAAVPLGMAMGGVIGDATGKNIAGIYLVAGSLALFLVLAGCAMPSFRRFLATDVEAEAS